MVKISDNYLSQISNGESRPTWGETMHIARELQTMRRRWEKFVAFRDSIALTPTEYGYHVLLPDLDKICERK